MEGQSLRRRPQGQTTSAVAFNQPSQAERREPLLTQPDIRIRDVKQGAERAALATEKVSGGSNPDGTILRIEPAEWSARRFGPARAACCHRHINRRISPRLC
jgi:hypothetical protein